MSLISLLVPLALIAASPGDVLLGTWETAGGKSRVEVIRVERADRTKVYQANIVWLDEPTFQGSGPEHGDPLRDANNPDVARQHDPVLGLRILDGFKYNTKKRRWQGGTVYDPESGKTYKASIRIEKSSKDGSPKVLALRGYIGIRLLGRTTRWTRVKPANQLGE